jgi:hypothetical protein
VSERLLFNTNSAIFQLAHDKNVDIKYSAHGAFLEILVPVKGITVSCPDYAYLPSKM